MRPTFHWQLSNLALAKVNHKEPKSLEQPPFLREKYLGLDKGEASPAMWYFPSGFGGEVQSHLREVKTARGSFSDLTHMKKGNMVEKKE